MFVLSFPRLLIVLFMLFRDMISKGSVHSEFWNVCEINAKYQSQRCVLDSVCPYVAPKK